VGTRRKHATSQQIGVERAEKEAAKEENLFLVSEQLLHVGRPDKGLMHLLRGVGRREVSKNEKSQE